LEIINDLIIHTIVKLKNKFREKKEI
jgi:hypothetical protein